MSRARRASRVVTAGAVLAVWAVFYIYVVTTSPPQHTETPAAEVYLTLAGVLAVPMLLWVAAALTLIDHWWSCVGAHMSTMDPPGRLLAAAVATLPDHRREWGMAMTAELAEVGGRSARWRFALSCAAAALWTPRSGGWPVLVLVTGAVVTATTAAGSSVGAAVPGMGVFAVSFVGLAGALVVLAVARSRRLRLPVPAPTLLVAGGLAASIAMTAIFLLRQPTAAENLSPGAAVFLAAVLAGCLWVGVATPRLLGTSRLAPHLGAGAAVVYVVWLLQATHFDPRIEGLMFSWIMGAPAIFFLPAMAAAAIGRSYRSGIQAAVWTVITCGPLAYALWLPEALRRYPIDGGLLLDGDAAPIGENLSDALFVCLGLVPVLGLPCGVIGAAIGALITRPAVARAQPAPATINL